MEQIIVEGLEVFGYHGVYEQEKEEGQIFVVNCWIDTMEMYVFLSKNILRKMHMISWKR